MPETPGFNPQEESGLEHLFDNKDMTHTDASRPIRPEDLSDPDVDEFIKQQDKLRRIEILKAMSERISKEDPKSN